jgi:tetratricopeptide (TPR) repeat protein
LSESLRGLVEQNIPVVVAMQYEVSNSTASRFARRFYQQLAAEDPADIAAQEGRYTIALGPTQDRKRDFATPVIFMRVQDGYLFKHEGEAAEKKIVPSVKGDDKDSIDIVLNPPMPSNYNEQTWVGREAHLSDLLPKLQGQTRLLWMTGISGIGKTALGECLASQSWEHDPSFQWIYLEILEGQSPDFVSVATDLLAKLGDRELDPQERNSPDRLAKRLLQKLQSHPYWIQMDSLERLLSSEQPTKFVDPYWATFFQRCLTESNIVSRLVLTAQAFPTALTEFSDRYPNAWAELRLDGLLQVEQQLEFFTKRKVVVEPSNREILARIAQIYEGHPLVLKVIAEDILKSFAGDVDRYWQVYQPEFEQVARELQGLDETEYNEALDRKVRERIKHSLEKLSTDALDLLCRSAVFRRPVPKKFWLATISDRSPQQQKEAHRVLDDRALIEKEGTDIRQHNLIRSVAYDLLEADTAWEAAERKAADLWLTAYNASPDAPKLETVRGYLEAFAHYYNAKDWEIALDLLDTQVKDGNTVIKQIQDWSYFRELVPIYQTRLEISRKIGKSQKQASDNRVLGDIYHSLAQYEQAIDCFQQAVKIFDEIGDLQGKSDALRGLGSAYYLQGNNRQALKHYLLSGKIAHKISYPDGESKALGNLANVYRQLGKYERAIQYCQQDLKIVRKTGNSQGEGYALCTLGNCYSQLGKYEQAIDHHQRSLEIAKRNDNRLGQCYALCGLGDAYNRQEGYDLGLDYYDQSLKIARDIKQPLGEGIALWGIGNAYYGRKEYSKAIDCYKQDLKIARDIGVRSEEGSALCSLGAAQLKLEQYQKSLTNNKLALEIFQEIKDREQEAYALRNLAEVYQALGDEELAQHYCQQALKLATKLGIPLAAECEALQLKMQNAQSKIEPTKELGA